MIPPEPDPPVPEVTIPVTATVTGSATRVAMIITQNVVNGESDASTRQEIIVDPVSIQGNGNSHEFEVPQSVIQGLVYTDANNFQRLSVCYRNYNSTTDNPTIDTSAWKTTAWSSKEIVRANSSGTYADSYTVSFT